MSNIAFIHDNSLYMKGIVHILNEEIPEHTFHLYNYKEVLSGETRIHYYTDLLILELNTQTSQDEIYEKYQNRNIKMAVWTFSEVHREQIADLMKKGIDGYFYGDLDLNQFQSAILDILKGNKYIHTYFSSMILHEYARITNQSVTRPSDLLTNREWEVLEGISKGWQNEEIANQYSISDKTVKNHVSSIIKKLKVKNRMHAVLAAIRNNWVSV